MRFLTLELRKSRRTGVYVILPLVGILGAPYAFLNFTVRRDALLALPLPPMTILLTQLYGMIMVLNLFAVIAAACLSYHHEFLGYGLKKMAGLPVSLTGIFLTKFIFLAAGLALCRFHLVISSTGRSGCSLRFFHACQSFDFYSAVRQAVIFHRYESAAYDSCHTGRRNPGPVPVSILLQRLSGLLRFTLGRSRRIPTGLPAACLSAVGNHHRFRQP